MKVPARVKAVIGDLMRLDTIKKTAGLWRHDA